MTINWLLHSKYPNRKKSHLFFVLKKQTNKQTNKNKNKTHTKSLLFCPQKNHQLFLSSKESSTIFVLKNIIRYFCPQNLQTQNPNVPHLSDHILHTVSTTDFQNIWQRCRKLEKFSLPPSTRHSITPWCWIIPNLNSICFPSTAHLVYHTPHHFNFKLSSIHTILILYSKLSWTCYRGNLCNHPVPPICTSLCCSSI